MERGNRGKRGEMTVTGIWEKRRASRTKLFISCFHALLEFFQHGVDDLDTVGGEEVERDSFGVG